MAFHPYPQLIRTFCNIYRFGPPRGITLASPWSWIAHLVSGLPPATVVALFRLAFASAPAGTALTLLQKLTRWLILQEARHHPVRRHRALTACRHTVSGSISLPSSGCFSPFPHGTGSLSVAEEYLGLEGGPPTFRQNFTCSALLMDTSLHYPYGAITHYGATFPGNFCYNTNF